MKEAPHLQPGDAVGIAAPSAAFDRQAFEKGLRLLERWQLRPVVDSGIYKRHRYFAGSETRRVRELQRLIDSKDIKAILFARGGFGSHHYLPRLKLAALRKYPKRLIAYSDLTMLLDRIRCETGCVTYYGPTLCDLGRNPTWLGRQYRQVLFGERTQTTWSLGRGEAVQKGRAEGVLVGGCLTLLSMSVGTSFEFKPRNSILLIEDVNEAVYAIERFILHLKQSGKLSRVKGIIVSELQDGKRKVSRREWVTMLREVLAGFKGPIVYGTRFGHVKNPYILPLGRRAHLNTRRGEVSLLQR